MGQEVEVDDKGLYGLCVFGAVDKTNEEMEEMFRKYGEVVNINRSKELLFVRFNTFEEASAVLEAFQNDPDIRVRPAKRKSTNTSGFERGSRPRNSDRDFQQRSSVSSEPPPMPRLRPACKSPVRDPSKPKLEVTKVVIVGNLHPEIRQKDIYDLCSKTHAEPLHVNMLSHKEPNYRTIYYAKVFVKSDTDILNIKKGLDNLKLNGLRLVVHSRDDLLEEDKNDGNAVEETK